MSSSTQESTAAANEEAAATTIEPPIELSGQLPSFVDLLPEPLQPYWQFVQNYPLLEAGLIIVIFWLAAYLVRRFVIRVLENLAKRSDSDLDDDIIDAMRPAIFRTVLWFGVIIAFKSAGLDQGGWAYVVPLALTLVVLAWIRASLNVSGRVITALAHNESRFTSIDIRTEPLLIIVSKIIILVIGAYVVLVIWGINPVGLLASAGVVGIAVGFAAKDTLANLFSGVFILADRPYNLGDYVNLDSGERGMVTHIGIRSTRLLTRDDIEVTIPNGVMGNAKVVNESGGSHIKMRVRMDVQCAYEADLDYVCGVLQQIAEDEPLICDNPAPRVRVRGFADSGINLQLMGWIDHPENRGRIRHLMYMAIHRKFNELGLEIPYPKRDISLTKSAEQS